MSYTLRDLPLPVKVVATVFLMAVGAGYLSAMVQLHVQDAKSGKAMPTIEDVVRKYTGKVKYDPNNPPPQPVSRLEALVMGPDNIAICGLTMAPAFTTEDRAKGDLKFSNMIKGKTPEQVEAIKAERKGEQAVFQLWIKAKEDDRKKAYDANHFEVPQGKMPNSLTPAFKDGNAVKIKSIIDNRCVTCHAKDSGESKADAIPLDTYEGLLEHMHVEAVPVTGDWVKVEEPISVAKLTQSTHAHLLSWAVLFSLTGVIFAFSSYPTAMRCVLGPWVVIAVFADVSLWWLARYSDQWGPYFARAIIGTGMAAGAGLFAQIVLSLFNMYGTKGKLVIGALFVLGGVIAGLIWVNKVDPALKEKAKVPVKAEPVVPPKKDDTNGKGDSVNDKKDKPYRPINQLDLILTLPVRDANGKPVPPEKVPFHGSEGGSMVPAFFERDKEYKKLMEDPALPQKDKDKLKAERQAELEAVLAWVRSPDAARKAAYDGDGIEVPPALAEKIAPDFVKGGKVHIKAILDARCGACHAPEKKQEDFPLTNYEELSMYLQPFAPPEAPAPPEAVDAIPPAKEN